MRVYATADGVEFLLCAWGVGSFAAGEAFDPGPSDEFSIGFEHAGNVSEAELCETF